MFNRAVDILKEGLNQGLFSGAAIGIVLDNSIVTEEYIGAVSFDSGAAKIDANTKFDLASVTKIFATTSIALRFIDQGLIRLDDTVGYFFPEASSSKSITIRQLLTHTSGEPAHFLLEKEVDTPNGILELLLHRPLAAKPGEVEAYSCMGYILLGEILKKVSGKNLDVLFKEEVADVLGLENTFYGPLDSKAHSIAKTLDFATGEVLEGIVHDENARFQGGVSANAGLFSSLKDLLQYSEALLDYGFSQDDESFISPRTLELAIRNYTAGMNEDRGLGFFLGSTRNSSFGDLLGEASFGHTGFTGTSVVIHQEENIAVVILTNRVLVQSDGLEVVRMRARIHNAIMAELSKDSYE